MFAQKQKGFSLVEILVVVGIIGLLLTGLVLSLNSKQKEIRDIKRVNDIQTLRNAIEVVKNEKGGYDQAACDLGIVSVCASKSTDLSRYLLRLSTLNDPVELNVACTKSAVCASQNCNYALTKLEADDYEIRFHLEKGVDALQGAGCYSATPRGISKL